MLKRSFLEFHAQKAAPEALVALQKGRDALVRLRGRPWPASLSGATRPELEEYCEACARIEELTAFLQVKVPGAADSQEGGEWSQIRSEARGKPLSIRALF
jgi:hypothetical protein